jgi:PAS domain S-box-containing protein
VSLHSALGNQSNALVLKLAEASDFCTAVHIVADQVLGPSGVGRMATLIEDDKVLRGRVAVGWSDEEIGEAVVPLTETSAVSTAFESGRYGVAKQEGAGHPAPLPGLERYGVFPLFRRYPAEAPFGVLIADLGALADAAVEPLAERLAAVGPMLFRLMELDELRRLATQLERQRELLTSIVNALPDPVLITDSDNRVLLENRRAESLLTTAETDSEGRRRAVEINNLLLSSFLTRTAAGETGGGSRELNLVDPSEGGDLLFEVISTGLPSTVYPDGAIVSVLREVTDLKRAATELEHQFQRLRQAELKSRRERDRLNLILETVGDPILVTDDQANIILMNPEAERLFEVPQGAGIRDKRRQGVRANDTKVSSFISDLALSPDRTRVVELNLWDPDTGDDFPVEVVSGKIFNERYEMAAIVSIFHDLTKAVENERLAAELAHLNEGLEDRVREATTELEERNRQLEWQRRELERAYQLKSEFLASMSHELRTPINALLGYTSLMRDRIYGELTPRQEEALQRMYSASQHLLELVNDVLDLAKIEAGKMPVNIESVALDMLIRELSLTIDPMVRRKNLEFELDVSPELPVLETDRTKIKQILLNLLSNAVKFTHEGSIVLRAMPVGGGGVSIEVRDSGIGIAPDDMGKIFEDFRQVDQSSTREYGGTGLGLSITKKLLNLLGGTISVDSEAGVGSTFFVWLPLRSRELGSSEQAARAALGPEQAALLPQESRPES